MNLYTRHRLKAGTALICSLFVTCSAVPVYAATSAELTEKTTSLQSELDGINEEMLSISEEISSVEMQTEIMTGEIQRTEASLVEAQANEAEQYENMKTRIKYMYENGDTSLVEMLFSAESMSDFLNKADFIQTVSDYDREMLEELCAVREEVEVKEETLQAQQEALQDLQAELAQRQAELQQKAEETSTDLAEYTAQLEAALAAEAAASSGTQVTVTGTVTQNDASMLATQDEVTLLAAIIQCEAYQDYNCMLAVATVILNRVNDSRFPNSITEVVYADGQFEPVQLGSLAAVLSAGPTELSYQVARDALAGARLAEVADCYYFLYAGSTSRGGVNVGNNLFFTTW